MGFFSRRLSTSSTLLTTIIVCLLAIATTTLHAQSTARPEARVNALPIAEDRGTAAIEQSLRRLRSFKSVMAIVAHPDDEDGSMLTYESRVKGARVSLMTLTRGEGGQNAMGGETYDALGLLRTNELLAAGEYYGVRQYWGTQADFGFSKTREESLEKWTHDRVLYDAVLAVRRERPWVITSTFVGGITDGHGQHQVSGQIAQEVYDAASDPNIFPDQFALGVQPWKPFAVYGRTPFAPVTEKGMFDYATGKWAAARFFNYVTKQWSEGVLSTDVRIPTGTYDAVLGRSAAQVAREGWGLQRSQYGGGSPALSGDAESSYHLFAARSQRFDWRSDEWSHIASGADFFPPEAEGWKGLFLLAQEKLPSELSESITQMDVLLAEIEADFKVENPAVSAPQIAAAYRLAQKVRGLIEYDSANLSINGAMLAAVEQKLVEFEHLLALVNGVQIDAFRAVNEKGPAGGLLSRGGVDESPRSVTPGERFLVRVHLTSANKSRTPKKVWLESATGKEWKTEEITPGSSTERLFAVTVPANEQPTEAYFHRTSIEEASYKVDDANLRGESFAPYPLTAWAEYEIEGVPVRVGEVVQTLERVHGFGGIFEPLVVTPRIGVRLEPEAKILPPSGTPLPVEVRIHTESAASGELRLSLPTGWTSEPASAHFEQKTAGDSAPLVFVVTPFANEHSGGFSLRAIATVDGQEYSAGWQRIGYDGLRPYNLYKDAVLRTRQVDVKLATGLRVGYVMGTGDEVPEALRALGAKVDLLTADDVRKADLTRWQTIVVGIRAYSVRPELAAAAARFEEFMRQGGNVVVEYQSKNFPAPYKLELDGDGERVTDEADPVKILAADNPLLNSPNKISAADFDGWVEERGHGFLASWSGEFTPLTVTADPGQDAQQGGLVVANVGKGRYVYCAFALHRQVTELVPGAYRILANLISTR